MRRLVALGGVVAAAAVAGPAVAQQQPASVDRMVNGGAEQQTTGWAADRFTTAAYGSAPDLPGAAYAARYSQGQALFVARDAPGATLSQTVSLADVAGDIDAAAAHLDTFVRLGGAPGVAAVTYQLQDGAGGPLGTPITVGPADAAQLAGAEDGQIECDVRIAVLPAGTRAVRVTLRAAQSGLATADFFSLYAGPTSVATPARAAPRDSASCSPFNPPAHVLPAVPPPHPPPQPIAPPATPAPSPPTIRHVRLTRVGWSFDTVGAGSLTADVQRRSPHGRWVTVNHRRMALSAASSTQRRRFARLRAGSYRLRVRAFAGSKATSTSTPARRYCLAQRR